MNIEYLIGDATAPAIAGMKIIVHVCNDIGGWGRGFVLALSKKWPQPEAEYRRWYQDKAGFELGNVQFVQVEPEVMVANMIGQRNIKATKEGPPVRYEAIDACLEKVSQKALDLGATVHMPRIGCGLAGGQWERIEPLVHKNLSERGIAVYVYDWAEAKRG